MPQPVTLREHLAVLPPYTPIEPFEVLSARLGRPADEIIKLDANENPYGPSERTRQALATMAFPHIYPDPESRALRAALARHTGIPMRFLVAGSGADELIDLILRLVLEPGDAVISCPPTFGMYPFDIQVNAGSLIEVPRRSDFSLDVAGIVKAVAERRPKVLFLATPNNPDGSLLPRSVVEDLLELPILVVLDEAYVEFCDGSNLGEKTSLLTEAPQRDNLIVLRTFSKWAGLAGLRVGYGTFPEWMLPAIWKAKQPYNVNVAASVAAIAALDDLAALIPVVKLLKQERQRLFDGLSSIPYLHPYASQANFILCKVLPEAQGGRDAAWLKKTLAQKFGILVRYFEKPRLKDHIRVSVGKPEHSDALLKALREIHEEGREYETS
jgi:histidinol-phosphate aminotransferase